MIVPKGCYQYNYNFELKINEFNLQNWRDNNNTENYQIFNRPTIEK